MEKAADTDSMYSKLWTVRGETFELSLNYTVIDYLGAGAYGVVCSAYDEEKECMVAIKKCKNIFDSRTIAVRVLREMRILRNLQHENIIRISNILDPSNTSLFRDMYIVFEVMQTDLDRIIRGQRTLTDGHVQHFTAQVLSALAHLHFHGIIHRDLKPRNILVNGDCTLKVADFGLSRLYSSENDTKIVPMTEYVTTRWYRAPEVLLGWDHYTSAIDVWAAGTIMGELILRYER